MEYKGLTIDIESDIDRLDPRVEWYNVGTMYCRRDNRYALGDRDAEDPFEFDDWSIDSNRHRRDDIVVVLPLYLHDHGNISMAVNAFEIDWNPDQYGWIYVTRDKVLSEYGWKRITKARREKLIKRLVCEVETYSQYLSGEVYCFLIKDDDGFVLDSLSGLFGLDSAEEEAKMAADVEFSNQMQNIKECLDDQTRYTVTQLKKSVRVEERLVTYAERN